MFFKFFLNLCLTFFEEYTFAGSAILQKKELPKEFKVLDNNNLI